MITAILSILGGAFTTVGQWLTGYSNPKTIEARRMNDETDKKDQVHNDIKNQDIDSIRRDLS